MLEQPEKIFERSVNELIDTKLKPIKDELQRLQEAHVQDTQILLSVQRMAASLKVSSETNAIASVIDDQLPDKESLRTQLFIDAADIKSQINSSNDPIRLATEYHKKWVGILEKLGAEMITF